MDTMAIRWVDHLAGRDLGVFSLASDPQKIARMITLTPTPTTNLSQDHFEKLLFDHLPSSTQILFEHSWVEAAECDDGYVSTVEGPDGTETKIQSQFIIGADGAGSRVRAAIGASLEGPKVIQRYLNVHFHADLRDALSGREGLLFWVINPDCSGTFIAHNIDHDWVFMKPIDTDESFDGIDEAKYAEILHKAIGTDADVAIQSMSTWIMSAQVSDAYQKDGIFLVGDAAHRFPPTGGLGMNTGFQDAHNLAWKIAMAINGFDASLLSTYEPERRPSAVVNAKQSHQNFLNMSEVDSALDIDGDGTATKADFDKLMSSPDDQAKVQAAIERQAKHFNMSGYDLGVCYKSNAIKSDGPPPVSSDPVTTYIPSTVPGARLPHCWLVQNGQRISTLDLLDSTRFLVLSSGQMNDDLVDTIEALKERGYPVEQANVSIAGDIKPADDQFQGLFSEDKVLVVRPDSHIAARLTAAEASSGLEDVFVSILGDISARKILDAVA